MVVELEAKVAALRLAVEPFKKVARISKRDNVAPSLVTLSFVAELSLSAWNALLATEQKEGNNG